MKKTIIGVGLLFLSCLSARSQNGLENIIVEKYYVSSVQDTAVNSTGGVLPIGSVTYRIYVDMKAGYKFEALYGTEDAADPANPIPLHEFRIATTTSFFNNESGEGSTAPIYTKAHAAANTVMLDSWFSAGAACAGSFGILKSEDNGVSNVVNTDGVLTNSVSAMGIPLTTQDGIITTSVTPQIMTPVGFTNELDVFDDGSANGSLFSTTNASVASLNGSIGPDTTNKVLVGQFTTDGDFSFELNVQIGTPGGQTQSFVAKNPTGNEVYLASLTYSVSHSSLNTPPTVSITSPANGATLTIIAGTTGSVTVSASAADGDGTIASVEFFVNSTSIGTDASAPYQAVWTSTVAGTYTLTAVATDNLSAVTTSANVIVTKVNDTNGINDPDSPISVFNLYPNPMMDMITMEIAVTKQCSNNRYTVYDINGNIVLRKEFGIVVGKYTETIDMSGFVNGQYMIELIVDGSASTKQIIKN